MRFGKLLPFPTFSFSWPNQAEAWKAFKLHARDYLRYHKIKWDTADESQKGYITFRLMITEMEDREMLDDMEDDGSLPDDDRKTPKTFFGKIEQLKIQKPENEWKYRDELMSGLKQNADETVHQLRTRIETLVSRSNFELEQLRQSLKILALVRAVRYHEVREWIRHPDQKAATFQQVYDYCREMEDRSRQYTQARAEGRATLAAHTAAKAEAAASLHAVPKEASEQEPFEISAVQTQKSCSFCGLKHRGRSCPAYGQTCNACGGANHFQSVCKKKQPRDKDEDCDKDQEALVAKITAKVLQELKSVKVDTINTDRPYTAAEEELRALVYGNKDPIFGETLGII